MEYKTNLETKKCQKVLVEMMKDIHDVCLKNNINYFLSFGSVLGARRHEGFIPWDDDIDLGMKYDDFCTFLRIAQKELGDKYEILHYSTNKHTPQLYAKVVLKNSVFLEYSTAKLKIPHGFFIDVFPHFGVPEKEEEFDAFVHMINKIHTFYNYKKCGRSNYFKGNKIVVSIKKVVLYAIHLGLQLIPDKLIIKKYEDMIKKYHKADSKKISCMYNKSYYTTDELFPLTLMNFESEKFLTANTVDKYLERAYGDFMKLPPIEQRLTHKPLQIVYPEDYKG